ncbi:Protein disulfide-isomerase like 2-2 [Camellia lanceoleosa]|uniref:Protein disulfide-isomerase like 2-2 n=1 Tax=Camellia lanceoleosa TaxID=1840588 RepID=A0ACC0I919_9ERIC|nr:Protein disulfide-isomerase like 2-2 [Camellia lanceoleosa]
MELQNQNTVKEPKNINYNLQSRERGRNVLIISSVDCVLFVVDLGAQFTGRCTVPIIVTGGSAKPFQLQEYGIKGFPTIKVFVPGKPLVDYQGARDEKPIADYALQQVEALLKERLSGKGTGGSSEKSEPSASVELNSHNFDELVLRDKELWIVEFFAPCN